VEECQCFPDQGKCSCLVYLLTRLSFQLSSLVTYLSLLCCGGRSPGTDVQLTKDLVPVLFHDYSLSESGTDIPIHDVTLEQVGLSHQPVNSAQLICSVYVCQQ